MLHPQFLLPVADEILVDLFAGGGGASTGIEAAVGRHVDVAVNHDPEAVSLHEANHPQTRHYISDVFEVDPLTVTEGRPIGLLWASPDCKHFSKAKGGRPVSKKIRGLANVVVDWVKALKPTGTHPRVICLENVEEFQDWGPLLADDKPCPIRKGEDFRRWVGELRAEGYRVEWRELRACDYGAPTIRKRLFVVARRDGLPIVWPAPTHGPGLKKKHRTAADCIDWTRPCPSIFLSKEEGRAIGVKRPLADNTLRRIAHGIKRYVLDDPKPFIVPQPLSAPVLIDSAHSDVSKSGVKRWSHGNRRATKPLPTVVASGGNSALVMPTLIQTGYGERPGQAPRVPGLDKPLGTIVGTGKHAIVAAYLAKHFGGEPQDHKTCTSLTRPAPTVTARDHSAVVEATLQPANDGAPSRAADVRALLIKYYGTDQDPRLDEPLHTITTKPRFGVVTVHGTDYEIADIGMRMLTPRELYRAQGFPESYRIDRGADGRPLSQEAQTRMCGNSVSPVVAQALVAANYSDLQLVRQAA